MISKFRKKRRNTIFSVRPMKMFRMSIQPTMGSKEISLRPRMPIRMNCCMPGNRSIAGLHFMTVWHNSGRSLAWDMPLSYDKVKARSIRNSFSLVWIQFQVGLNDLGRIVTNLKGYWNPLAATSLPPPSETSNR